MRRSRSSSEARTGSIMRLLMAVSALWMPGVSMKMIWAFGERERRPGWRCAWSAAYRRRWPLSGRPERSAAWICRRWAGRGWRRSRSCERFSSCSHRLQVLLMRTCSTRISSLASTSTRMPSRSMVSPGLRHAAQPFAHQASDGGGFDLLFAVEGVQQFGDAVEIEIAGDDEAAVAIFGDVAGRVRARRGSRR